MYFIIDIGHNSPPKDLGAGKPYNSKQNDEDYHAKLIGDRLVEMLYEHDHDVLLTCPGKAISTNESLQYRVNKANKAPDDSLFVSIHLNDADPTGHGSEVFVYTTNSNAYGPAKKVLTNICNLGYRNRGVKTAPFYVLKYTKMPAMLVECCFVDSLEDEAILTKPTGIEDLSRAIFEGITGKTYQVSDLVILKVTDKTPAKPNTEDTSTYSPEAIKVLHWLELGHYKVKKIASEEGHYYLEFLGEENEPTKISGKHFVYAGHCELIKQ